MAVFCQLMFLINKDMLHSHVPDQNSAQVQSHLATQHELTCHTFTWACLETGHIMLKHISTLRVQGVCTHVSDVKPHIVVATYTDTETGYELYQQVTGMHNCVFLLVPHQSGVHALSTGARDLGQRLPKPVQRKVTN